MKVVMVLMEGRSGMFQYAALLSNALARRHRVTVIGPTNMRFDFFSPDVKVVRLHVGDTKRSSIMNTVLLNRMVSFLRATVREHADVIHFHNPYVIWTCPFLPCLRKHAVVLTLPDGALAPANPRFDRALARKLHCLYADCLIVLGENDKADLLKEGIVKPAHVIPHGENTLFNEFCAGSQETDSVLCFGGISERKGLEYLIQAAPLIQQKAPSTEVVIAGEGSLERYAGLLKAAGNVRIDNRFIPQEEVSSLFRKSKVVVLPYTMAVHSGVIPIAYSFGKPVVVTDLVADMVNDGETGLVVPPRNAKALAEAVVSLLLDDERRRRMGAAGRAKAKAELDWEMIAAKTTQVYEEAVRLKRRSS